MAHVPSLSLAPHSKHSKHAKSGSRRSHQAALDASATSAILGGTDTFSATTGSEPATSHAYARGGGSSGAGAGAGAGVGTDAHEDGDAEQEEVPEEDEDQRHDSSHAAVATPIASPSGYTSAPHTLPRWHSAAAMSSAGTGAGTAAAGGDWGASSNERRSGGAAGALSGHPTHADDDDILVAATRDWESDGDIEAAAAAAAVDLTGGTAARHSDTKIPAGQRRAVEAAWDPSQEPWEQLAALRVALRASETSRLRAEGKRLSAEVEQRRLQGRVKELEVSQPPHNDYAGGSL